MIKRVKLLNNIKIHFIMGLTPTTLIECTHHSKLYIILT